MAKWVYALLISTTIATGISILFRVSGEPPPAVVMSPSMFDSPEEIGTVLVRRFYGQLSNEKIAAFGAPAQPEWQRSIVRGFILAAAQEKIPFDLVISEEQMPPLDLSGIAIETKSLPTNTETQSELIETLQAARAAGKRVLIYTANVFTTHLIPGNSIDRLEKHIGLRPLTISAAPLALRSDQEYLVEPPCLGLEVDKNGTSPLGCAVLTAGRMVYRKHVAQTRYVAIMNSPRPNDYLLMVSAPGQALKSARN